MIVESSELSSIWNHLEELRSTFIKIFWVILLGTGIAFFFHPSIVQFLSKPLTNQLSHATSLETYEIKLQRVINSGKELKIHELPQGSSLKYLSPGAKELEKGKIKLEPQSYAEWEQSFPTPKLLILGPIEGLSISLKVSLWIGLAGTSPLWFYFIFQFIAPALHQKEKLLVLPFAILSLFFISLGIGFAYIFTIPLANRYLFDFNEQLGVNLWSFSNYIDYTILLILSNALAFELFAVVIILVHYGFLRAQMMQDKRKHFIVSAFILGALLTPPDILSQVLIAIPMIIFYEITLLYALMRDRRKKALSKLRLNMYAD